MYNTGGYITRDKPITVDNAEYMPNELYSRFEALAKALAHYHADVAQLAERVPCKDKVVGSSPAVGSKKQLQKTYSGLIKRPKRNTID